MTVWAILVGILAFLSWWAYDRARGGLFWYDGDEIHRAALAIIWPYRHESYENIAQRFRTLYPPRMRRAVMEWADFYEERCKNAPREEREFRERMARYDREFAARKRRVSEIVARVNPTHPSAMK